MEAEVPYMLSVSNLPKILDAIQRAGAPDAFGLDFLKDLGFTSSNDRAAIKLLKFLGLLDPSGKPTQAYKEFMDQNRAKSLLGSRLRKAYDDLFTSDKDAQNRTVDSLKGWFKTKTGSGDSVAAKMASTFKSLASYATFGSETQLPDTEENEARREESRDAPSKEDFRLDTGDRSGGNQRRAVLGELGFVYRIEVHLPETTNVETYRAIFKAIREELQS